MRKFAGALALLLSVVLCLSFAEITVEAEIWALPAPHVSNALEGLNGENLTVINRVLPPDAASIPILPLEGDIESALPQTVFGIFDGYSSVECPVSWDTSGLTETGKYTVSGTVSPPAGYLLANTELEHTTLTIALYKDQPVVFFAFPDRGDAPYHGTVVLQKNGVVDDVLPYEKLDLVSPQKDFLQVPLEWDLSSLDTGTVGRYTVYAKPILPPGAGLLNPGDRVPQDIYVMEPDAIDLGAYNVDTDAIFCSWLTTINPGEASLEFSTDGIKWLPIEEAMPGYDYNIYQRMLELDTSSLEVGREYYFRLFYQNKSDGVLHVVVSKNNFTTPSWEGDRDGGDGEGLVPDGGNALGKPPAINGGGNGNGALNGNTVGNAGGSESSSGNNQSTESENVSFYSGEMAGTVEHFETLTPPITAATEQLPTLTPGVPIPINIPAETTVPPKNTSPTSLPQSTQTTAQPPSSTPQTHGSIEAQTAQKQEAFSEIFGEAQDLISGTRLLLMLKTTGEARFTKQGITAILSAEGLEAENISDSDGIEVTLRQEGENGAFLGVSINGTPLTTLENTCLMVPYRASSEGAALLLTNEQGEVVAQGEYDAALAVATFSVDALGQFTVTEKETAAQTVSATVSGPPEPQPDQVKDLRLLLSISGVTLAIGMGVGLFFKGRRGK